jgi:hypothetical protein
MEDTDVDDVKTLLAGFREETTGPDPAVLAAARRRLVARALAPERSAGGWARRRPAVRIGVATGAVGAVAAGILLVPQLLPDPPSAAAVELLGRAADAAGRSAPGPLPGPGDVLYTYGISSQVNGLSGDLPVFREHPEHVCHGLYERWTPVDGRDRPLGRNVEGVTGESARDPRAPATADPLCSFDEFTFEPEPGVEGEGSWQSPDRTFVGTLPVDARALHDRARSDAVAHGYADTDGGTLTLLRDLAVSGSPEVGPALRAALFRAIALVPGVDTAGTATTLLGDTGSVVARTDVDGFRQELVFDPDTGTVLGEREIAVASSVPGVQNGTVYSESATRAGIVGEVGERPTG